MPFDLELSFPLAFPEQNTGALSRRAVFNKLPRRTIFNSFYCGLGTASPAPVHVRAEGPVVSG